MIFLSYGRNKNRLHGLLLLAWINLISAWISEYIHYKLWEEITYPFPNFNGCTVEVWEWIWNFLPHFIMNVFTYLCWDYSQSMVKPVSQDLNFTDFSGDCLIPTTELCINTLGPSDILKNIYSNLFSSLMGDRKGGGGGGHLLCGPYWGVPFQGSLFGPRFLSQGCIIFDKKILSQGCIFLPKSLTKGMVFYKKT